MGRVSVRPASRVDGRTMKIPPKGKRKQHGDFVFWRKVRQRRRMLSDLPPGAAYVPFIGDGDLAVECYPDRQIYGADLDEERVAVAKRRLPRAKILTYDCDSGFPFASESGVGYALCDSDAWARPYDAIQHFWQSAPLCDEVVIFGTSGEFTFASTRGYVKQPDGSKFERPSKKFSWTVYRRRYFRGVLLPYLRDIFSGRSYVIKRSVKFDVRGMIYWGVRTSKNE